MSPGQQVSFFTISRWIWPLLAILVYTSCTTPKRYQKFKPFVYKTNINLEGNLGVAEKRVLKEGLTNQLDDSLRVRTVLAVGLMPPFFYYRLAKPPVFDTLNVDKSKSFMTSLLNSQGYFHPVIQDTFTIDSVRDQYRVTVDFNVNPGVALRLDSVGFDIRTPEFQQFALQTRSASLLKKDNPYSLQVINAELDRLLAIFRDNGYYRISKDNLYAEVDTVAAALIDPSLDPFEQFRLLEELRKKREQPTINVVIKERVSTDTSYLRKFHIGSITVFPDLPLVSDSLPVKPRTTVVNGITFHHFTNRFKLRFISRNISLRTGELFQQSNYYKTINTFTERGAWQQVDIDLIERSDSLPILNAEVRLYPAKKLNLNIDFETSRNASDVLTTGSLFGIGFNLGIRNRNAFRESIETNTNLRFGVELGRKIVQTLQASFSHTINIPRFILPFRTNERKWISPRTVVLLNTSYTQRFEFFEVRSMNASWGYEGSRKRNEWSKKSHSWQWIPFNFEYTSVIKSDSFNRLSERIPTLKQAFNDGLIISQVLTYNSAKATLSTVQFFRARIEESGAFFGMIRKLDEGRLRRFIKVDAEYKYFVNYKKSTIAFRVFGGVGHSYGRSGDTLETTLPFFKAYIAGGPYSMRAWQVRQLGLGSNKYNDTLSGGPFDRFGDIKLEGNVEYRFDLANIFGVKVKSALFIDAGNIWNRSIFKDSKLVNSEFRLAKLYKDLAVAGGTSIRLDFDFFLIRFDWAYKLKNPLYAEVNSGWFQNVKLTDGQFQLGIGYPF